MCSCEEETVLQKSMSKGNILVIMIVEWSLTRDHAKKRDAKHSLRRSCSLRYIFGMHNPDIMMIICLIKNISENICEDICFEKILLENMLFRGFAKGWYPKGWFWRMFPSTKNRNEGTFRCSPVPKPERGYIRLFPGTKNRNEGTFAKTTLLQNHPFVSSWLFDKQVCVEKNTYKENLRGTLLKWTMVLQEDVSERHISEEMLEKFVSWTWAFERELFWEYAY